MTRKKVVDQVYFSLLSAAAVRGQVLDITEIAVELKAYNCLLGNFSEEEDNPLAFIFKGHKIYIRYKSFEEKGKMGLEGNCLFI